MLKVFFFICTVLHLAYAETETVSSSMVPTIMDVQKNIQYALKELLEHNDGFVRDHGKES